MNQNLKPVPCQNIQSKFPSAIRYGPTTQKSERQNTQTPKISNVSMIKFCSHKVLDHLQLVASKHTDSLVRTTRRWIGIGAWIDFEKKRLREAALCVRRTEQAGEAGCQPPTTRLFGSASAQEMHAGQRIELQNLRGYCQVDSRTTLKNAEFLSTTINAHRENP
jgi:hypothetical protein